ncbi:MAG: hypothetical protein CMJ28_05360 [Phycisphaerae bacterium]|nr:hypothetical protein [Phycisphaerae bacterium]
MFTPPFRCHPLLKSRVWGGQKLADWGRSLPNPGQGQWGESWELADLPEEIADGQSIICDGPLAGQTFRDALKHHSKSLLGDLPLSPQGGFPLLVKLLDAQRNLSVQVHPTAEYAEIHPGAYKKDEAWLILDAHPGSTLYTGLADGITPKQLCAAARRGEDLQPLMHTVPAVPGTCHVLQSGTCHALGGGILVAEFQTPSDTTYRVWDWGREGREMHLEHALACMSSGRAVEPSFTRADADGLEIRVVATTPAFVLRTLHAPARHTLHRPPCDRPEIWLLLEGDMMCGDLHWRKGDTVFFPADSDVEAEISPGCRWVHCHLPFGQERLA